MVRGKKNAEVAEIGTGDIGAVAKLTETRTGDTLCAPGLNVVIKGIDFPRVCYTKAIVAKNKAAEEKIATGLDVYKRQVFPDPISTKNVPKFERKGPLKENALFSFRGSFLILYVFRHSGRNTALFVLFLFHAGLGFLDDLLLHHRRNFLIADKVEREAAPAARHGAQVDRIRVHLGDRHLGLDHLHIVLRRLHADDAAAPLAQVAADVAQDVYKRQAHGCFGASAPKAAYGFTV